MDLDFAWESNIQLFVGCGSKIENVSLTWLKAIIENSLAL